MGRFLPSGTVINGYEIREHIGTGGEGFVFSAESPRGDTVVLKQHKESASDPRWKTEIERVWRLQRLVGKHDDNVCDIYEVFEYEDLVYVAMERVVGESLESLSIPGPLTLGELAPILLHVLGGLGWLHGEDIVHRDVKPGNIVVPTDKSDGCEAKLIDFSIALHRGLARLSRKCFGAGTYEYAPLEVSLAKDAEIDGRADLHSVGATAFHAITGRLPFEEPPGDALFRRLASPARPSARDINPAIPESVDHYIQRLMAFHVDDRPATADQARAELEDILAKLPHEALSRSPHIVFPASGRASRFLVVESGAMAGTSIPVPRRGITLGRHALNPADSLISRSHFRAKATRKGVVLRDVGSSNGLIKGTRRLRTVWLSLGETIGVGATTLKCV